LTTAEPEVHLRARGLTKRFGARPAVAGVDLEVFAGECFALVGPDGAGKTTTIRLLVGILERDEGELEVLGLDPARQGGRLRPYLGYVPQRFGLYDDLTVAENLKFYARLFGVPPAERRRRIPELLSFARLEPFETRLAGALSGGMRQKLGLICALLHRPRLLFLDDPTFGIDPVSRRDFWQILHHLLADGITVFLSTAYLDEAERASRVGLLHQGRLLVTDTPEAIRAAFRGELLEVRGEHLDAARELIARHPMVRQTLVLGDRLLLNVDRASEAAAALKDALAATDFAGLSVSQVEPALEDVFVQLVRGEARP
jgi:ABC-2 type transport system ATP-binding protein